MTTNYSCNYLSYHLIHYALSCQEKVITKDIMFSLQLNTPYVAITKKLRVVDTIKFRTTVGMGYAI
jgi:hypothetical protein